MKIVKKEIPLSTLEIAMANKNNGTLWLNGIEGCILRISKLKFSNTDFDKFRFVDIDCSTGLTSILDSPSDNQKDLRNFMVLLNQNILNEMDDIPKDRYYLLLNEIIDKVKEFKENV